MKIQHFMALVVLSLGFKARALVSGVLTLACLLVAAPATAQVNYFNYGGIALWAAAPTLPVTLSSWKGVPSAGARELGP